MKVTDKQYYLDDNLITNLDFCMKRQKKNFDHLIIFDGDEGYGKTTLSFQCAYYCAWKQGKKIHYFFDLEEMLNFASQNEEEHIVWDEAALGALGTDWASKIQKLLIKMLMVARKKRHFFYFNIPKFYKLSEYVSVDRSIALIHVYSEDHLNRGNFVFFNKRKKQRLFEQYRKSRARGYNQFNFAGKFVSTAVVDEEAYDKAKDDAILSIMDQSEETSKKQIEIWKLKYNIWRACIHFKLRQEDLARVLGVGRRTLGGWGDLVDKIPAEKSLGQFSAEGGGDHSTLLGEGERT